MAGQMLIYGANGFTGRLIAERAPARGLTPILAGRDATRVGEIAARLGLPHRAFALDDAEAVRRHLQGVDLVLHCAGPYSATSRPMVDACLAAGAHYLDITGEISVIQAVLDRAEEARRAGVVLMPAVGFDVVPTDCMAKKLVEALPDASALELAFGGGHLQASPGTAKTTVEGMTLGALARRGGELVRLPKPIVKPIPFGNGSVTRTGMSLPWGDLASAFRTTGIPDITVYAVFPAAARRGARVLPYLSPVLGRPSVQAWLKGLVARRATGPSDEERQHGRMWIWGRVQSPSGRAVEGHLQVPEGYELTVLASLMSAEAVLSGKVGPGAHTPAGAFGADFVTTIPGAGAFELSESI
jgi:short subunit dehydrogenase-like uncharacterized protein